MVKDLVVDTLSYCQHGEKQPLVPRVAIASMLVLLQGAVSYIMNDEHAPLSLQISVFFLFNSIASLANEIISDRFNTPNSDLKALARTYNGNEGCLDSTMLCCFSPSK